MEENKYYTPELSEFHHLFEFEIHNSKGRYFVPGIKEGWYSAYMDFGILGDIQNLQKLILDKQVRVPFLSKEDIEAEGFKVQPDDGQPYFYSDGKVEKRTLYKKDGLFLTKWDSSTAVVILLDNLDNEILFQGTIKNKSEFKKILKMIGI